MRCTSCHSKVYCSSNYCEVYCAAILKSTVHLATVRCTSCHSNELWGVRPAILKSTIDLATVRCTSCHSNYCSSNYCEVYYAAGADGRLVDGGAAAVAAESHDAINSDAVKDNYVDTLNLWVWTLTFVCSMLAKHVDWSLHGFHGSYPSLPTSMSTLRSHPQSPLGPPSASSPSTHRVCLSPSPALSNKVKSRTHPYSAKVIHTVEALTFIQLCGSVLCWLKE